MPTDHTGKIDPLQLSGLTQAIYVLKSLRDGLAQEEIVEQFGGDKQLVDIWTSFLFHNRWMDYGQDGQWIVTEKGQGWIEKRFPK